jgi:hypothetical protein
MVSAVAVRHDDQQRPQVHLTEAEEAEKQKLIKKYAPEEKYHHCLTEEEAKMLVDMELFDQRLLENMEKQMEKALALLRGMCMACYACYNFDEKHVKVFKTFKKDIFHEVAVFKMCLLPITVLILKRLRFVFEEWLEKEFDWFCAKIESVAEVVLEHRRLVHCLELWFANLAKDMGKWKDHANIVLDELYLDSRRIRTDEHVLRVSSKVETGVENTFIPLLFVPGVNKRAAPYVHGGQQSHFKEPPVAHTVEERVIAGTLAMTETLAPCLGQFRDVLGKIGGCLDAFKKHLDHLHALGVYEAEVPRHTDYVDDAQETAAENIAARPDSRQSRRSRESMSQDGQARSLLPKLQELEDNLKLLPTTSSSPREPGSPTASPTGAATQFSKSSPRSAVAAAQFSGSMFEEIWLPIWRYYRQWEWEGEEEMMPPEIVGGEPRHRRILSSIIFKHSHYHAVYNRGPRIQARCDDIGMQYSLLLGDMEEVPFDREKYGPAWLEQSEDPDGVCIKDHVYEATKNIEVILTVD